MLLKEIMTNKPQFLPPDATLKQAADIMRDHDFGFIPIGENDRLIGTVTDRDIALRAVAEGKDPNKTQLRDVMTNEVFYCFENDSVEKAAKMMEKKQIRRLIVLDDNKRMTGIVSLGDIVTKVENAELCSELTESVSQH